MATFPDGRAIIFGGSGGIGSGISRVFTNAGCATAIVYRGNEARAAQVAEEGRACGANVTIHHADVSDQHAVYR